MYSPDFLIGIVALGVGSVFLVLMIISYVYDIKHLRRGFWTIPADADTELVGPRLNPFITLWYAPSKTLIHVAKCHFESASFLIVIVWGVTNAFAAILLKHHTETSPFIRPVIGLMPIIVVSVFSILVTTFVLYGIGKIFGGKGTTREVNIAVAWSCPPLVLLNIVVFAAVFADSEIFSGSVLYGVGALTLAWWFALMVGSLAAAHQISRIKASATVLITGIIFTGIQLLINAMLTFQQMPAASQHGF
jgi:hypothetical protein